MDTPLLLICFVYLVFILIAALLGIAKQRRSELAENWKGLVQKRLGR